MPVQIQRIPIERPEYHWIHNHPRYRPNPEFTGVGIWDNMKNAAESAVSYVGNKAASYATALVKGREDYPPKVRKILESVGNKTIQAVTINRSPLGKPLMTALQVASGNTFLQKLANTPYDKLFHLSVCIDCVEGGSFLLEKNEVINADANCKTPKDTESRRVSNMPSGLTVNQALGNTKKRMGGKFFGYSAKDNNCQDFISSFLQSNKIGSPEDIAFVKQETKSLFEGNDRLRKIANTLTDLGSRANILTDGLGVQTHTGRMFKHGGKLLFDPLFAQKDKHRAPKGVENMVLDEEMSGPTIQTYRDHKTHQIHVVERGMS
jgi:hypothetical protein